MKALLAQALGELVDNTVKASPTGSKVRISVHAPSDRGISVEVTDSGPGLPGVVRKNLGVPFLQDAAEGARHLQSDTSLTRRWSGVGIGLSRARKIAELNGGDIEFAEISSYDGTWVCLFMRPNAL